VSFRIKNIGTIPAKFVGFNLNGGSPTYDDTLGWSASLPGDTITFQGWDSEGQMVPIGAMHIYSVSLQVTGNATFGETYAFTIGVVFEQGV
jgi:hypothetical protein